MSAFKNFTPGKSASGPAKAPKKARATEAEKQIIAKYQYLVESTPKFLIFQQPTMTIGLGGQAMKGHEIALGCSVVENDVKVLFGTADVGWPAVEASKMFDRLNNEVWGWPQGSTAIFTCLDECLEQLKTDGGVITVVRPDSQHGTLFSSPTGQAMVGSVWNFENTIVEFIVESNPGIGTTGPCTKRTRMHDSLENGFNSELHLVATFDHNILKQMSEAIPTYSCDPIDRTTVVVSAVKFVETAMLLGVKNMFGAIVTNPRHVDAHCLRTSPVPAAAAAAATGNDFSAAAAAAAAPAPTMSSGSETVHVALWLKRLEQDDPAVTPRDVLPELASRMMLFMPASVSVYARALETKPFGALAPSRLIDVLARSKPLAHIDSMWAPSIDTTTDLSAAVRKGVIDIAIICCDCFNGMSHPLIEKIVKVFPEVKAADADTPPSLAKLGTWSSTLVMDEKTLVINFYGQVNALKGKRMSARQLCYGALRIGFTRLVDVLIATMTENVLKEARIGTHWFGNSRVDPKPMAEMLRRTFGAHGIPVTIFVDN